MKFFQVLLVALALALPLRADPPAETPWTKIQEAFAAAIEKGHQSTVALKVKAKFREAKMTAIEGMPPQATNMNYFKRPKGVSSGVVLDGEGHILTSFFNVNADDKGIKSIEVTFADGKKATGTLLGYDEPKDIALIKVDPAGLNLVPIEMSETAADVGQFAMALGRAPEADRGTATRGIVSAVDRYSPDINDIFEQCIQFDAKTNYGNSGGPIVDLRGRMMGLVAHVRELSPWGQNSGISFATPNHKIKDVLPRLKAGEKIKKPRLPFLGVQADQTGPPDVAGARIGMVVPGGAAANAGVQAGDVVVKFNEEPVKVWGDLVRCIQKSKVGDTVKFTVQRGEETLVLEAVLGERPPRTQ